MNYKKLFWGFIFLFDLRIAGVDAMPDVLGYIFFYQGLSELETRNSYFTKAKAFAFPMIFISLLDIFQPNNMYNTVSTSVFFIINIIGIAIIIINLLMVYNICLAIIVEARKANESDLEAKAHGRWKFYLVTNIIVLCSSLLVMVLPSLFAVMFIIGVVSYILMLGLMNMAAEVLA